MRLTRRSHDSVAALLHIITVVLMFQDYGVIEDHMTPGVALLVMQITAALFHVFYVLLYVFADFDHTQNQYKWIEYAISATAGTIAVLSVNQVDTNIIAPLAVVAVLQQAAGLGLDPLKASYRYNRKVLARKEEAYGALIDESCLDRGKPRTFIELVPPNGIRQPLGPVLTEGAPSWSALVTFLAAAFGQMTEFGFVVAATVDAPVGLPIAYILGWGSFGVHSAFRQLVLRGAITQHAIKVRYDDLDWVEAIYSALGWIAKLGVLGPEWLYLRGEGVATINAVVASFLVVSAAVVWQTVRQEPLVDM